MTFPQTGIHKFVLKFIDKLDVPPKFKALDCPAGDGRASHLLKKKGADVLALDLYPEFFKAEDVVCRQADLCEGFPVESETFDFAICEEGIEHLPDQLKALQEFNRILKKGGGLLVTTPSMSHLRARLSFLLGETEYYRYLPPSEADSIWYSIRDAKVYYGHIFLLTAQKLRTLSILAGFELDRVYWTDVGRMSVLFFPLIYPFNVIFNFLAYWRAVRGRSPLARQILKQVLLLNLNPKILLSRHHMFYFKKRYNAEETRDYLKNFSP